MKPMKNKTGIIIAAVIMLFAIGIISFLSVDTAEERGGMVFFSIGGVSKLRNTIEIPLSEADELWVLYSSKNLEVYPAKGDTVTIKEYLISDRAEALAEVTTRTDDATGKRTVEVTGGKMATITLFGLFAGRERVEVYVPKEGLETLKLRTKSGNIAAKEDFSLKVEKLEAEASSGNIKWHDTNAQELSIQASSGNVGLERMTGNITVKTGSGGIKLREAKGSAVIEVGSGNITVEQFSGQGTMSAGSGNITVEQFSGQGFMEAGSGNVKVEALEVTGDMKLQTGSGNIRLYLPKELSFRFEAETTSGNINTSFDEVLSYSKKGNQASGEIKDSSTCLIRAQAKSGNINVTTK